MSDGRCCFCGEPVEPTSGYRRIVGWERIRRPPTGAKGFVAPERLDEFACAECVRKLAAGLSTEQGSLLA